MSAANEQFLQELESMGFDRELARKALIKTNNAGVAPALELCLSGNVEDAAQVRLIDMFQPSLTSTDFKRSKYGTGSCTNDEIENS